MINKPESQLTPCPWCAVEPEIVQVLNPNMISEDFYATGCQNRHCPVRPHTDGYQEKDFAKQAWEICSIKN